jgi:hypothetical protein
MEEEVKNQVEYIVIDNEMFVYQATEYCRGTNIAHLTLYKNPDDLRAGKSIKQITVGDWH